MAHQLPPLPYANNALEPHIDALTMEIHHDRHHKAYVDQFEQSHRRQCHLHRGQNPSTNWCSTSRRCRTPSRDRCATTAAVTGTTAFSGTSSRLTPAARRRAPWPMTSRRRLAASTISKTKLQAAGVGRFGSGWAWLVSNHGKLEVVSTANQDIPLMGKAVAGAEGTPILGVDVWEHAYYLKYQNKRADYLKAFWNVVNWNEAAKHYAAAKR